MAENKRTLAVDGPRIEDFLDAMLDLADFDLDFDVTEGETLHPDFENPDLIVRFTGPDVELLLANKAELLLALEQLTMEALRMAPEEHSRICFDANDHRMLRIQELRMSAEAAAERVKKTHAPFHFSPMNSRERRILHLSLRNETEVRSESVGEAKPHPASGHRSRRFEGFCPRRLAVLRAPVLRTMRLGDRGGPRGRGGFGRDQRRSRRPQT